MFRFKLYINVYGTETTLTSDSFTDFTRCAIAMSHLQDRLWDTGWTKQTGGSIERHVEGIGWTVYDESTHDETI